MIKFPYGLSDFYRLITEGYLYVDRTSYIRVIEELGTQLLFLRPRRFGKSLWLSTLENYYDVAKADEFERLFGQLAIGKNPTPRHNQYLIMRWNFSLVDPQGGIQEIKRSLHAHINGCIEQFMVYYHDRLDYTITLDAINAIRSFQSTLTAIQHSHQRLYLLIDEYDNFANTVLMSGRPDSQTRYTALLRGEGALKTVFKAVKAASEGLGLERVFITGTSPLVLNDVTSGYNVGKSITLEPDLDMLCGFSEDEVTALMQQLAAQCDLAPQEADTAMATMRTFYNGYAFSDNTNRLVYNPTLALYFMEHFQRHCQPPSNMLDSNLAMDRQKLMYVSRMRGGKALILNALQQKTPVSVLKLEDGFGLEALMTSAHDTPFMASLLYYLGVLTMGGRTEYGELILRIPNLVVRRLYVERLRELLLPDEAVTDTVQDVARALYQTGDLQPACDFVEQRYFRVLDNRDYRWASEMTLKTAFLTLLFNDVLYIMESETVLERAYADLVMIVRPDMRQYRLLDILIEFKYVRLKEAGITGEQARTLSREEVLNLAAVRDKLQEAKVQLLGSHGGHGYRCRLEAKYGERLRLRTYIVVALGFDRLAWIEA